MQTPNAFPHLAAMIVQLTTNPVKSFIERLCSPHSDIQSSALPEAQEDADKIQRIAGDARSLLAGGASSDALDKMLSALRDFDTLFRGIALTNAAHWYAIVVEKLIGTGHIGQRFEYDGARYVFHDYRERGVILVSGEVSLRAAYYRREGGGQGLYPLDIMLGLDRSGATCQAVFLMAHFASESDYEGAQELIARATGLSIDQNRLHRCVTVLGEDARALQGEAPAADMPPVERMVIETDGLMTPMRYDPANDDPKKAQAGWHEAHVGVVAIPADNDMPHRPKYRRKDRSPERKGKTKADRHSDIKLVKASYVASYEGRERHLEKLQTEALRCGLTDATSVALIGDGADWVQEWSQAYFPNATHIVDWHHAAGRLATARDVAYDIGAASGRAWYERQETNLWKGDVEAVVRSLLYLARTAPPSRAKTLRKHAAYFRERAHMMNYPAYRKASWPIGSGAVESACRHVVQERCKCSGMRWSGEGLRNVLAVRTTIINGRFDELWKAHTDRVAKKRAA